MPTVLVPANVSACDVDIPEKIKDGDKTRTVERTILTRQKQVKQRDRTFKTVLQEVERAGAIHIRPCSSLELTDDEWACFKDARPDLARRFIVVEERDLRYAAGAKARAEKKAKAKAAKEAAAKPKVKAKADPPAAPATPTSASKPATTSGPKKK